jgi:predicted amidohydrolase YtcJ
VIDLTISDALLGAELVDIDIAGERIVAIVPAGTRRRRGGRRLDAEGGAVVAGLHDHHIHLGALAAARTSLVAGPPAVRSPAELVAALRAADEALAPGAWIRAVGYHESVAGDLDRRWLDGVVARRPVRVQHRSGRAWMLNSAAATVTGLDTAAAGGVERAPDGTATGRVFGGDDWLRDRVPAVPLDLDAVGRELASYGITAVTDATPIAGADELRLLAEAVCGPRFPIDVVVTGAPELPCDTVGPLRGPVKLVVADHDLPPLDSVVAAMRAARRQDRAVAVHCVTREALLLTLAAWDEVGVRPGDRIEHGAVVPLEVVPRLSELGLTVVTQPAFVFERGDAYLADVEPADVPDLWRCGSLVAAGVPVAAGSDAPYGSPDPWVAIAAAVRRRTAGGQVLGAEDRVDKATALGLFLGPLAAPGGPPREVAVGAPADVCVLDGSLAAVLEAPSCERVIGTVARGTVTFER